MVSLIVSIIALGVIIMIHELGHFLAARAMGVGVIEFSIGMGPRLCSKVVGNVRYSLRVFPFGGSCMMLGEELDESNYVDDEDNQESEDGDRSEGENYTDRTCGEKADEVTKCKSEAWLSSRPYDDGPSAAAADEKSRESGTAQSGESKERRFVASEFNNAGFEHNERSSDGDCFIVDGRRYPKDAQFVTKPAWRRFIVIAAGPVFNFILAFLLSVVICAWFGFDKPYVMEVEDGGPIAEAGIEPGDSIYAIAVDNSRMTIQSSRDLQVFMYVHADELNAADAFTVYYRDSSADNTKKQAVVSPFYDEELERYRLGFSYNVAYDKTDGLIDTLLCSQYNVNYCIRSSIESLKLIFKGKVTRQDVMGPVRMVAVMDETVDEASSYGLKSSMLTLFDLMLLISGSLGFMNLLPLPALDGGRLIFIIIEMITRRAVPKELEAKIHTAGMILLLGLMLFIMMNDVSILMFK